MRSVLQAESVVLERYQIESLVSKGRNSIVYRCQDVASGRTVALRELRGKSEDPIQIMRMASQFRAEFEVLSQLEHPNLPRVWDLFEHQGSHCFVMDFIPGVTLDALVRANRKPMEIPEILSVTRQLAEVLGYLHSRTRPIIFRDLAPSTILVDASGAVKLIDFGIARILLGEEERTRFRAVGSPEYSPPEQFGTARSSPRTDMYSLGATLYFLSTGTAPPRSTARATRNATMTRIRDLNEAVPPVLEDAICHMMEVRRDDRTSGVDALQQALGPLLTEARVMPLTISHVGVLPATAGATEVLHPTEGVDAVTHPFSTPPPVTAARAVRLELRAQTPPTASVERTRDRTGTVAIRLVPPRGFVDPALRTPRPAMPERDTPQWRPPWEQRVTTEELAISLTQISVMLRSGLLVGTVLEIMAAQSIQPRLKDAYQKIAHMVFNEGSKLSTAFSCFPALFPADVILLITTGEAAGQLDSRLQQAADLMQQRTRQANKMKESLTSPILTMVTCLCLVFVVVKFVFPRFVPLYHTLNIALPPISQAAIHIVMVLDHPLFLVFTGLVALAAWQGRDALRDRLIDWGLNVGWSRRILGQMWATSFCDTLAQLQGYGVSLRTGLEIMSETAPVKRYAEHLRRAKELFEVDGSLSGAVAEIFYFPPLVSHMIVVGEETGELSRLLHAAARLLDSQNQEMMTRLAALVEPLTMALLGGVMSFFCIGLFLPVYEVMSHLTL